MDENLYIESAHLYDLDPRDLSTDDIKFYEELAMEADGPILELGCGTGRISIHLAKLGHCVDALDLSNSMLGEVQRKISQSGSIKGELRLFYGDMKSFSLSRKYSLIIIPRRGFQVLTSASDKGAALSCVRRHLIESGSFILNVFKPYGPMTDEWISDEKLDWETVVTKNFATIRRYSSNLSIDPIQQNLKSKLRYEIIDSNGKVTNFYETCFLAYYYGPELQELLVRNGFRIIERFGYYDRRSLEDGPEQIIICKDCRFP